MYLKSLHIENNGPLRKLILDMQLDDGGRPKPMIVVGANGSGKTNLLSTVADALFEAAAAHFFDAVPSTGNRRPWFRMVGTINVTAGASGGFSILGFEDSERKYFFTEKAGNLDADEVRPTVAPDLVPAVA